MANDFGWALMQMRAGHAVRRPSWRAEGGWIELTKNPRDIVNEDGGRCSFRDNSPLLATDWEIVPDAERS